MTLRRLAFLLCVLIPTSQLLSCSGCSREEGQALAPPYDAGQKLGRLIAVWNRTDDERRFDDGDRLAQPQVRFQYRLDARNRSGDKLFVRLTNFRLVDSNGHTLAEEPASVECTLPDGNVEGLMRGDLWLPKSAADRVKGFRVSSFALPLDQTKKLRAWQMQGRADAGPAVDAEIARYAAAPICVAR